MSSRTVAGYSHVLMRSITSLLLLSFLVPPAFAAAPADEPLPVYSMVSGTEQDHVLQKGETAWSVATRMTMSPALLKGINPDVNVDKVKVGGTVRVSDRHIVPTRTPEGFVVDIADRTLYWFENGALKARFPVAVGRNLKWSTPRGRFWMLERRRDPVWRVPPSIQAEMRAGGKTVITEVKPGPKNPLGKYFIALSGGGVGFHGTNAPGSVGRFATHGCMRMLPGDIERLYKESKDGTYVETVYEPVSAAQDDMGRVWLEVHPDVYRGRRADPARIREKLVAAGLGDVVDWERVDEVVKRQWGTAEDVTRRDAPVRMIIEPMPELVEASLPARFVVIGTP